MIHYNAYLFKQIALSMNKYSITDCIRMSTHSYQASHNDLNRSAFSMPFITKPRFKSSDKNVFLILQQFNTN